MKTFTGDGVLDGGEFFQGVGCRLVFFICKVTHFEKSPSYSTPVAVLTSSSSVEVVTVAKAKNSGQHMHRLFA